MDELKIEKYKKLLIDIDIISNNINDVFNVFEDLVVLLNNSFLINEEIGFKSDIKNIYTYFDDINESISDVLISINNKI